MINKRIHLGTIIWWLLIVTMAFLLKGYYRSASETELQWMLQPLAFTTSWLLPFDFELSDTGVWFNARYNIEIVKSCAGINFMIMALLGIAPRLKPTLSTNVKFNHQAVTYLAQYLLHLFSCLMLSWCLTLLVNTIRVWITIQCYVFSLSIAGLTAEQVHRLAGMAIYFPALCLIIFLADRVKPVYAVAVAALLYLAWLVLLPLLTGNYRNHPIIFFEHTVFILGFIAMAFGLVKVGGVTVGLFRSKAESNESKSRFA